MLFRKKIEPRCAYCSRAGRVDHEQMICSKKGVVAEGESCRHFHYDPLKRVPSRLKPRGIGEFKPEDFQL